MRLHWQSVTYGEALETLKLKMRSEPRKRGFQSWSKDDFARSWDSEIDFSREGSDRGQWRWTYSLDYAQHW